MKPGDPIEDRLEQLTGRVLGQQPLRKAPASLEARVLAEIGRRARHVPWWRRGIAAWPTAGRSGLIAVSLCCIGLIWVGSPWLWARLETAAGSARLLGPIAALEQFGHVLISLAAVCTQLAHALPRVWLLGGLLAAGALYFALFALVYCLLSLRPRHSKVGLT